MNTATQPLSYQECCTCDDAVIDTATMPMDMVMYWREVSCSSWYEPAEPAPIWEFYDEHEIPEHMTCVDETGCVLVEEGENNE